MPTRGAATRGRRLPVVVLSMLLLGAWLPAAASAGLKPRDLPLPVQIVLHRAQNLMAEEAYAEAADLLKGVREERWGSGRRQPSAAEGDALVDFTIGNALLMSDRPADAGAFYAEAARIEPGFHEAWVNLAKCHYDLGRHREAGDSFVKAYDTAQPPPPELLYYAAVSFSAAGRHDEALAQFERLLRGHPEDVKLEWKVALVQIHLALDQPRQALPVMEELAERSTGEERRRWQETLLYQYLSLDMEKKALAYVKRLTREDPLEAKWWQGQLHLHLKGNRYREALVALTVRMLLAPPTQKELALAGDLSLALDIPSQAATYFERSLQHGLEPETLVKAAQSHMRLHRYEEALEWVDRGLARWKDPRLDMLRGNLHYLEKRYREAAEAFIAAAEGMPRNAGEAWLMAGYAAWNADDVPTAERALAEALKFKNQKKAAAAMIADIETYRRRTREAGERKETDDPPP